MIRDTVRQACSALAVLAVVAAAGPVLAQAPYQGTQTSDYSHPVQSKGQPTVFISNRDYAKQVQTYVSAAEYYVCKDKEMFGRDIAELDRLRGEMDSNYNQNTAKASALAADGRDYSAGLAGSQAQRSLDDANSIASTIVWLKAKWAACPPPPPKQPPPAVFQSGQSTISINGGFLGGGNQQTAPAPPPKAPDKDSTDGETGSVLQGSVLQHNVLGGMGVIAARPADPNRAAGDSQTQDQPINPVAHPSP